MLNSICHLVLFTKMGCRSAIWIPEDFGNSCESKYGIFKIRGDQITVSYMDDAYEKFWRPFWEQGYSKEAETLHIEVLDKRNKILGVEHPDTIDAMGSLGVTYHSLEKYTEAEKEKIQVLDASNIILAVEHPNTISTMENLAATNQDLAKYMDGEKQQIQVQKHKA